MTKSKSLTSFTRLVCAAILVTILGSCLSQTERTQASNVALADPRLNVVLSSNAYTVESIRLALNTPGSGRRAIVTIAFDHPPKFSDWPLDSCDALTGSTTLQGVAWLVDLESKQISAVSPVSGGRRCFSY